MLLNLRCRPIVAGLVVAVTVLVGAASGTAATRSKGTVLNDACTIVTQRLVAQAFGRPAGVGTPTPDKMACDFGVGVDPGNPPGGSLIATQFFPNFFVRAKTAPAAVEDQRAIDDLSGHDLTDVIRVGRSAYLDRTSGTLVVLATKRYAFVLRYAPALAGTPISSADGRALKTLARAAVARAPR